MSESGQPTMPAGFGLATATFVVVASMVGVGILTTSGHTVALLGSNGLTLGLWAIGGVIALAGALSLAELAAMIPRSGGEYVFVGEAYGPRWAFAAGWASLILGFAAPIAAASQASATYLLAPAGLFGPTAHWAKLILASAIVVFFAVVHASGHSRTARAQGVVTTVELVILIGFVVFGLSVRRFPSANLNDLPTIDVPMLGKMLFSLVYVSYGYTGWNAASYLAGEVADPRRRLPQAILIGTVGVAALYLGMNLVYASALPASKIHAIVAQEGRAAIDPIAERAARILFGPTWSDPFSIALGLILSATTSAYLLTGPRVMFAMAHVGHFPAIAGRLSKKHGTPAIASLILTILGLVLLWSGSFEAIVIFAGVGLAISSMAVIAAVIVLRVRMPHRARPFRVPGYPFVPLVYLFGTGAVVVAAFIQEPVISTLSVVSLSAALPVYELLVRRLEKQEHP